MLTIFATAAQSSGASAQSQFGWTTLLTSALTAAVISALVAAIGQWVARANAKLAARIAEENAKLSANLEVAKTLAKSRQEWINVLREDMAQYAGISAKRSRTLLSGEVFSDGEFAEMVIVAARIRMRLNPKEKEFGELVKAMSDCSLKKNPNEIGEATGRFVSISQNILKREWEVLKGELLELKMAIRSDD